MFKEYVNVRDPLMWYKIINFFCKSSSVETERLFLVTDEERRKALTAADYFLQFKFEFIQEPIKGSPLNSEIECVCDFLDSFVYSKRNVKRVPGRELNTIMWILTQCTSSSFDKDVNVWRSARDPSDEFYLEPSPFLQRIGKNVFEKCVKFSYKYLKQQGFYDEEEEEEEEEIEECIVF